MRVPIACSLSEAGARSQLGEWRDALAASVAGVVRPSSTELVLRLHGDLEAIVGLVELAQREKACCPFFEFSLVIEADALFLRVSVPEEAAPVLDGFVEATVGP